MASFQANGGDLLTNSVQGNAVPLNFGLAAITYADADVTASSAQYQCRKINCTGTNTAQRKLILPVVSGAEWYVANNGTGQNLQCIGVSGTGIIIANTKGANLWSDGVNIYRQNLDSTITT